MILTYHFHVQKPGGLEHGTFGIDSSIIPPDIPNDGQLLYEVIGLGENGAKKLIAELDFTWEGQHYDHFGPRDTAQLLFFHEKLHSVLFGRDPLYDNDPTPIPPNLWNCGSSTQGGWCLYAAEGPNIPPLLPNQPAWANGWLLSCTGHQPHCGYPAHVDGLVAQVSEPDVLAMFGLAVVLIWLIGKTQVGPGLVRRPWQSRSR